MTSAAGEIIVLIDDDVEPIPEFLEAHAARHVPATSDNNTGDGSLRPPSTNPILGSASRSSEALCSAASARSVDGDSAFHIPHSTFSSLAVFGPMSPDPHRREPVWIAWEHAMLRKQYAAWESGAWKTADAYSFYSGNASFRREWALAIGGFDVDLKRMEDVDFGQRLQHQCGVTFEFDPRPIGVHRPTRSYASWLNIAAAYGRLDVVRATSGQGDWARVRHGYVSRNAITGALADVAITYPFLSRLIRWALSTAATIAYTIGLRSAAMSALSVVYNVRYLECAAVEMGLDAFRALVKQKDFETIKIQS